MDNHAFLVAIYSVEPHNIKEYVFHKSDGIKMSVHFVINKII